MSGRLVKLSDGKVELGVIPDIGGVVSLLRLSGKENLLKADPAIWNALPRIRRKFGPETRWKAYNGHIVWVGPQSEWWMHQDKSIRRQQKKAVWPPDPYLNFGYFEITEFSENRIVMQGPASEFTGLQMTKTIEVRDGRVLFYVSATNIRTVPVSWDLWLNTRVDGYARCYVPISDPGSIRIDGQETRSQDISRFKIDEGYLSIEPLPPSEGKKHRWAKAFIPADEGWMAAFVSSQALVIRFEKHAPEQIHPEHALVEIYNYTSQDRADALNELEYHAPYVTLPPGESMETAEEWELLPFQNTDHASCLSFLKEVSANQQLSPLSASPLALS